ncbi:hypothetical protein ABZ135_27820 [Streptomyces sp. NPDC006339]|uniref:hypothetical protein n=1 Tax=Streptomyces sp. NPDC006339 TaxID=3156755 RepID=UPI0033B3DCED
MTEHPTPEAPAQADPAAATAPVAPAVRSEERGRGRGRRLLAAVLPAALVLVAAGGGVTYTAVTVANADRTAETVGWEAPDPEAAGKDPAARTAEKGRASTPMSRLLLPVPEGFRLGPDVDSYGNDGELDEKEAVALLKNDARGLAGKKRRDYEKRIDKLGVQGIAVRSFASYDNGLVVEVQIIRMKNKKRIHDLYEVKREVAEILKFPKGPRIPDHRNASCFLMPDFRAEDDDEDEKDSALSGMSCSAYDSELLVSVSAAGSAPFDKGEVADLVKKQLDHIKTPGEYV